MAEACRICTHTRMLRKSLCDHALCVECMEKVARCPFCRADMYYDPDLVNYLQLLATRFGTDSDLDKRLKLDSQRLIGNEQQLKDHDSGYLQQWTTCGLFLRTHDCVRTGIAAIAENQRFFKQTVKYERYPLWFYMFRGKHETFTEMIGTVFSRRLPLWKLQVVTDSVERRVENQYANALVLLKDSQLATPALVCRFITLEQKRAAVANDVIMKKLQKSDYMYQMLLYSDETWLILHELVLQNKQGEQAMEFFQEFLQSEHSENSNIDGMFSVGFMPVPRNRTILRLF